MSHFVPLNYFSLRINKRMPKGVRGGHLSKRCR